MSGSAELLTLRLAMIGVIFLFVLVAALILRSSLRPVSVRQAGAATRLVSGPRLVVLAPAGTGLEPGADFQLAPEMHIGRDAANGIVLGDASVSGRHALLTRTARGWKLVDLGSTNGTLVDGRRIDGRGAPLRGGERVTFGAVVLRFQA